MLRDGYYWTVVGALVVLFAGLVIGLMAAGVPVQAAAPIALPVGVWLGVVREPLAARLRRRGVEQCNEG